MITRETILTIHITPADLRAFADELEGPSQQVKLCSSGTTVVFVLDQARFAVDQLTNTLNSIKLP